MNTRELNFSGFFTETMKDGTIRYYYEDPYTGLISELSEFMYYHKMERCIRGADLCEKIGNN